MNSHLQSYYYNLDQYLVVKKRGYECTESQVDNSHQISIQEKYMFILYKYIYIYIGEQIMNDM